MLEILKRKEVREGLSYVNDEIYFKDEKYLNRSMLMKLGKSINNYLKSPPSVPKSKAMAFGSMLDTYLTDKENFKELYIPKFNGDKRTKIGKAAYAEWKELNGGKLEISEDDAKLLLRMEDALKSNTDTAPYFNGDFNYQVIGATELEFPISATEVISIPIKVKADIFLELENKVVIVDLKTTADLGTVPSSIVKYKYHIQQYLYSRVFQKITGKPVEWHFAFVEKAFPVDSQLVTLNNDWISAAHRYMIKRIIPKYLIAKDADSPVYPEHLKLDVPTWMEEI